MRRGWRVPLLVGIVGLGIGVALGLAVSWGALPRLPDSAPMSALRGDSKDDYVVMLGMAYAQGPDLAWVQERLALLDEPDVAQRVLRLADKAITEGHPLSERRGLARLAYALGARGVSIMAYVSTPISAASATPDPTVPAPTATLSPIQPTATRPKPTLAPSSTPTCPTPLATWPLTESLPAYVVAVSERLEGEANSAPGQLVILVVGPQGESLPGVKVQITWDGGSDICITGLHPQRDPGYADMAMTPGTTYTVLVADDTSEKADGLLIEAPQAEGEDLSPPDAWRVVFRRTR